MDYQLERYHGNLTVEENPGTFIEIPRDQFNPRQGDMVKLSLKLRSVYDPSGRHYLEATEHCMFEVVGQDGRIPGIKQYIVKQSTRMTMSCLERVAVPLGQLLTCSVDCIRSWHVRSPEIRDKIVEKIEKAMDILPDCVIDCLSKMGEEERLDTLSAMMARSWIE